MQVEMSQTAQMLRQATPRTLLLFDELGRGTSTYDGTAIAVSVLRHLLTSIKCLTVFITHYPVRGHQLSQKNFPTC